MLKVALLYPDLLGTYGDAGNALVLVERARRRGYEAEAIAVTMNDELPDASLYLLGGGEDGPQRLASDLLAATSLAARLRDGAHVFAVCAGLQILGEHFSVEGNDRYAGLGAFDLSTTRGATRAVGDLVITAGAHTLVGFENHGGVTTLGVGLAPLGTVKRGRGNDGVHDGFRTERAWGTYAHGPVLALNPWLADEVLVSVTGDEMAPLASVADRLYAERLASLSPRGA